MYYCRDCKLFFEDEQMAHKSVVDTDIFSSRYVDVCPHCYSDDIVEAKTCAECGADISPDLDYEVCEECAAKAQREARILFEKYPVPVQEMLLDYLNEV